METKRIENVSRRNFIKLLGLICLGMNLPVFANKLGSKIAHELNFFVSIDTNGEVTLVCHRSEMGQGIRTSVPQIIADELAANIWQVEKSTVKAKNHFVIHLTTGNKISFAELATRAAKLPVTNADTVKLKSVKEFSLIGKDVKQIDLDTIVAGKAQYAQDIQLPDMLIASIQRPPVVGGKGNLSTHQFNPNNTIEATYSIPYLHHAPVETPAATAFVTEDKCVIWAGTQNPQWAQALVATELGYTKDETHKVELNVTLMGGAFGRKSKSDFFSRSG